MDIPRIIAVTAFGIVLASGLSGCSDPPESPTPAVPTATSVRRALEAAETYLASRSLDRARSILATIIERTPEDPRPYEMMARLHLTAGLELRTQGLLVAAREQFEQSSDWYESALSRQSSSAGLFQSAGEVAQLAGRTEVALSRYEQAAQLDPENPKSRLCAAQLLLNRDPVKAEEKLREALRITPGEPHAVVSLALALQRQGREAEAAARAAEALAAPGGGPDVRVAVARVYRLADRPREALELLLALPDEVRCSESATEEIALNWDRIDKPLSAGEAWADCFRAQAHRTDAWRLALRAAEALGRGGHTAAAVSWIDQAIMLDAPSDEIEAVRQRVASFPVE